MKSSQSLILVSMIGVLAACSSGPGDKDLQEAMKNSLESNGAKLDAASKAEIAKMKVIGCKDAGAAAYQCDAMLFGAAQSVRLVKSSGAWLLVQ